MAAILRDSVVVVVVKILLAMITTRTSQFLGTLCFINIWYRVR